MGGIVAKSTDVWHKVRPKSCDPYEVQQAKVLKKFDRVLRVLEMTKEHGEMFYRLFSKIDVDFSGDVDIWEFADFYELTLSLFIKRLFKQLDMHDKGGLFFGEYLFSIWNLGTLSYKEMIVFVYNLYDEAHTGLMSHETMRNVVLEMYELDLKIDERVPKWLLKNVDIFFLSKRAKAQAPYATIENFAKFCDKYPEFIKHALNLQKEVVSRSLDRSFWVQAKALRARMGIDVDPRSFHLYLKDLTEMGNEKNVTRPGGDADSDLDGGSDDDGDDGKSEDEPAAVTLTGTSKVINKRQLRKNLLKPENKLANLKSEAAPGDSEAPPDQPEATPRRDGGGGGTAATPTESAAGEATSESPGKAGSRHTAVTPFSESTVAVDHPTSTTPVGDGPTGRLSSIFNEASVTSIDSHSPSGGPGGPASPSRRRKLGKPKYSVATVSPAPLPGEVKTRS